MDYFMIIKVVIIIGVCECMQHFPGGATWRLMFNDDQRWCGLMKNNKTSESLELFGFIITPKKLRSTLLIFIAYTAFGQHDK